MESDLPWIPGAVMEWLLADTPFAQACHNRLSTRAPSDVSVPYATLQLPAPGSDLGGGVYKQLLQIDGWCAGSWADEDPEVVAWRMATRAGQRLRLARNVPYQTMHYSVRPFEVGPLPADTTRGDSVPLYHAVMRGEITVHNR